MAIKGFRHGGLKRFAEKQDARRLSKQHLRRIADILALLAAGDPLNDLRLPKYRLHALKGNHKGVWSVRVTANLCITFRVADGDAYDVDLEDYR